MAERILDGQSYIVPDGTTAEAFVDGVAAGTFKPNKAGAAQAAPATSRTTSGETPPAKFDRDALTVDQDWMNSASYMYRRIEGQDYKGDPKDLNDWALRRMAFFEYNLGATGLEAYRLSQADDEYKQNFLRMLDTWDRVGMSWKGAGNAFMAVATDPSNIIGLGALVPSLGVSTVEIGAAQATRLGTLAAIRASLRSAARPAVVGAVEGAVWGAAGETARQTAVINAGGQQGYDAGQIGLATGVGTVGGAVIAGGAKMALGGLGRLAGRKADDALPSSPTGSQATPSGSQAAPNEVPVTPGVVADEARFNPAGDPTVTRVLPEIGENTKVVIKDVVSETHPLRSFVEAVDNIANKGMDFIRNKADLEAATKPILEVLQKIDRAAADPLANIVRDMGLQPAQRQIVENAVVVAQNNMGLAMAELDAAARAATKNGAPDVAKTFREEMERVYQLYNPIDKLATEIKSQMGRNLASLGQQENILKGELFGLSRESILRDKFNITDPKLATEADIIAADEIFSKTVLDYVEGRKFDNEIRDLKFQFDRTTDPMERIKLSRQIDELAAQKAVAASEREAGGRSTVGGNIARVAYAAYDRTSRFLGEWITATVLGPSSVVINTLTAGFKVMYQPIVNMLAKGLSASSVREMAGTYGAMMASTKFAFKAAIKTFDLERSLITGETNKLLDSWNQNIRGPAIPGMVGRVARVWLRTLSATDEFFQQISYRGFVSGHAQAQAIKKGMEKGLKGAELKAFALAEGEKAIANAFEPTAYSKDVIGMLREKGILKGLSGGELDQWVRVQIQGNEDLFKRATNEMGKRYTDDLLYKRQFSGAGGGYAGMVSRAATWYEGLAQRHPVAKLFGQIFFRTPVRVFEEGIRMTPGVQFIAPRFIDDLTGKNGDIRQVRATGEALVGFGLTSGAMLAFATGKITGAGPSDWRERRRLEQAGWKPYSVKIGDKYLSYRNFDPLATPIKIIVNAMERAALLEMRKAQGEFVDNLQAETLGWLSVGVVAATQAVRDANLTDGVDQVAQLVEAIMDPEKNEKKLERFFGQKAQLLVPKVVTKGQKSFLIPEEENFKMDPVSIEQFARTAINPVDPKTTRQWDALGKPVANYNTGLASFLGFDISDEKDRLKDRTPQEQRVLKEVARVSLTTGKHFMPPHKVADIPGIDLREEMTADGKQTMYDAAMELYNKSGVTQSLDRLTRYKDRAPTGTRKVDDVYAQEMQSIIALHWNVAIKTLWKNDQKAREIYMKDQQFKNKVTRGQFETQPFINIK